MQKRRRKTHCLESLLNLFASLPLAVLSRAQLPFAPKRRSTGCWGERVAVRFLRRRGLRILDRNYRVSRGEIDIVALEGRTLVFVEVKSLSPASRGCGLDRIGAKKRRRVSRAARAYMVQQRMPVDRWRLDAVIVEFEYRWRGYRKLKAVRWYPGAFELE